MNQEIEAIFEGGVFRPVIPIELPEHQRVTVSIRAESKTVPDTRSFDDAPTLEELAREQGVEPFKFDPTRESFWPEDEDIDEFIAAVRRWRSGGE